MEEIKDKSKDPNIGRLLAGEKFRIISRIGVGGMGKVYKAIQLNLDKVVCIKILSERFKNDKRAINRFKKEAKSASKLSHPNIVTTIDFGQEDDGTLYIVMEYVEGITLDKLIKQKGPFSQKRAIRLIKQVLTGIYHAHKQGIIHRDLKPENIIVKRDETGMEFAKVMDFGIATIKGSKEDMKKGYFVGTPNYIAPEQALGLEVDERADLYSIGIILYQMLTGELPYSSTTIKDILLEKIKKDPITVEAIRENINICEPLQEILIKLLKRNRSERYSSALEVVEAFDRVLEFLNSATQQRIVAQKKRQKGEELSLKDYPVAYILGRMYDKKFTGTLQIKSAGDSGEGDVYRISIFEGIPYKVLSTGQPYLLGQIIYEKGWINAITYNKALVEITKEKMELGEYLVNHGLITKQQLNSALKLQLIRRITRIMNLTDGTFKLTPDEKKKNPTLQINIDPVRVIIDAMLSSYDTKKIKDSMLMLKDKIFTIDPSVDCCSKICNIFKREGASGVCETIKGKEKTLKDMIPILKSLELIDSINFIALYFFNLMSVKNKKDAK